MVTTKCNQKLEHLSMTPKISTFINLGNIWSGLWVDHDYIVEKNLWLSLTYHHYSMACSPVQ